MDLKGWLPNWVQNYFSTETIKSIELLQKYAAKVGLK